VDRIVIPELVLRARVGVTAEERSAEQDVVVDLVLHRDLAAAGTCDDLQHTVDYEAVCDAVADLVRTRPFHLIEAIAEAVAKAVLEGFDVEEVEVRVKKPGALRDRGMPYAAVEIRRRRDA
jgi:dihydroneopterin aldolase